MAQTPENMEKVQDGGGSPEKLLQEIETATYWLGELEEQKRSLEQRMKGLSLGRQNNIEKLFKLSVQEGQSVSQEKDELFQRAKMQYEVENDLARALATTEEIKDENERNRCLVHLAISILRKESDLTKADGIMQGIKDDKYGYGEYYEKKRLPIADSKSEGEKLKALIHRDPHTMSLTAAGMALRDIEAGDIFSAVSRLRVESDKINVTNKELYDYVIKYWTEYKTSGDMRAKNGA